MCVASGLSFTSKTNSNLDNELSDSPVRSSVSSVRNPKSVIQNLVLPQRSHESPLPSPEFREINFPNSESTLRRSELPLLSSEAPFQSPEAPFRTRESPHRNSKSSKKAPDVRKINKPAPPRIQPWEEVTRRPFLEGGGWASLRNSQDASSAQSFMSAHYARPGKGAATERLITCLFDIYP